MQKLSSWLFSPLLALAACAAPSSLPSPSTSVDIRHADDTRAVFQVSGDTWRDDVGAALFYVNKVSEAYEELGVPLDNQHLVLVFHGAAGYHLLNDTAYAAYEQRDDISQVRNPNADLVTRLSERGVRVELCSSTMRQRGWTDADLLPEVIVTPNAFPRVIDLQMDGYAHVLFN